MRDEKSVLEGVHIHTHTHTHTHTLTQVYVEEASGNVISGPLNQSKCSYQENVNKIKSRSKRSLRSYHQRRD